MTSSTETLSPTRPAEKGRGASQPSRSRGDSRWGRLPKPLRLAILLAILVGAWQLYVSLSDVSPLLVASPAEVATALWEGITGGALLEATLSTLEVLLIGMGVGIAIAAILTALATWSKIGEDLLTLGTAMLNPLPAIAILPLAILWFGLNQSALVFVIANAVIWPIAINVSSGFRSVNPTIAMVGRNIGLRGVGYVRNVLMPAALPQTITGIRTGWAFGWRTIIAAELVFGVAGSGGGLGFLINESRVFLRIPDVFAGLVVIALIGIAFDALFAWIERRTVVRWGMKTAA